MLVFLLGIIIDIDLRNILGKVKHNTHVLGRKLVLLNPQVIDKYLAQVQEGFDKHNILNRANKLYKRVRSGHTDIANIMRKYDQLDKEVFCICNKSEQNCRPTIAGRYDWSPALARRIKQLSYWRNCLKYSRESSVVKKLGQELSIPYIILPQVTL